MCAQTFQFWRRLINHHSRPRVSLVVFGLSASDREAAAAAGRITAAHLHAADTRARQALFAMVEMIGLGVPAGRQFRGKRDVDKPGDGRGVCAAGVPLQGERHELGWLACLIHPW